VCVRIIHTGANILLVSLTALCPEEAESALEATQFFTDDTPQGTHTHIDVDINVLLLT
jgi:hypothetical protein